MFWWCTSPQKPGYWSPLDLGLIAKLITWWMEIQHILLQIQFCANAVVSQSYFFAVAKSSEALQSDSLTQSNNLKAIFSKLMHVMQSIEFQNQIAHTEISNPIQCQLHYNGWKLRSEDLQNLLIVEFSYNSIKFEPYRVSGFHFSLFESLPLNTWAC